MNVFRPLAFLFVGMLCSSVNMPIFAQEYADKGDPTSSRSVQKPDTDKQEAANEKDDKEKEKEKSKKKPSKLAGVVVAPLPISSPAIGSGIIPVLGYIFPFSSKDKVSPPSTVGVAGLITNNGSRGFVIGGQLERHNAGVLRTPPRINAIPRAASMCDNKDATRNIIPSPDEVGSLPMFSTPSPASSHPSPPHLPRRNRAPVAPKNIKF